MIVQVVRRLEKQEGPGIKPLTTKGPAFLLQLECDRSLYDITYEADKSQAVFGDWAPALALVRAGILQAWRPVLPAALASELLQDPCHVAHWGAGDQAPAFRQAQDPSQPSQMAAQLRQNAPSDIHRPASPVRAHRQQQMLLGMTHEVRQELPHDSQQRQPSACKTANVDVATRLTRKWPSRKRCAEALASDPPCRRATPEDRARHTWPVTLSAGRAAGRGPAWPWEACPSGRRSAPGITRQRADLHQDAVLIESAAAILSDPRAQGHAARMVSHTGHPHALPLMDISRHGHSHPSASCFLDDELPKPHAKHAPESTSEYDMCILPMSDGHRPWDQSAQEASFKATGDPRRIHPCTKDHDGHVGSSNDLMYRRDTPPAPSRSGPAVLSGRPKQVRFLETTSKGSVRDSPGSSHRAAVSSEHELGWSARQTITDSPSVTRNHDRSDRQIITARPSVTRYRGHDMSNQLSAHADFRSAASAHDELHQQQHTADQGDLQPRDCCDHAHDHDFHHIIDPQGDAPRTIYPVPQTHELMHLWACNDIYSMDDSVPEVRDPAVSEAMEAGFPDDSRDHLFPQEFNHQHGRHGLESPELCSAVRNVHTAAPWNLAGGGSQKRSKASSPFIEAVSPQHLEFQAAASPVAPALATYNLHGSDTMLPSRTDPIASRVPNQSNGSGRDRPFPSCPSPSLESSPLRSQQKPMLDNQEQSELGPSANVSSETNANMPSSYFSMHGPADDSGSAGGGFPANLPGGQSSPQHHVDAHVLAESRHHLRAHRSCDLCRPQSPATEP